MQWVGCWIIHIFLFSICHWILLYSIMWSKNYEFLCTLFAVIVGIPQHTTFRFYCIYNNIKANDLRGGYHFVRGFYKTILPEITNDSVAAVLQVKWWILCITLDTFLLLFLDKWYWCRKFTFVKSNFRSLIKIKKKRRA